MKYSKLRSAIIAASIITLGSALTACGSSSDGSSSVVVESFLKSDTHQENHVALTKVVVNGNAEFIADDGQKIVQVHGSAGKDEIDLTIEINLKNLDVSSDGYVVTAHLEPESVTVEQILEMDPKGAFFGVLEPESFTESNGQQTIAMSCQYNNGQGEGSDFDSQATCQNADRNASMGMYLTDDWYGIPGYKVSDKLNLFIFSFDPDTLDGDLSSRVYTYTSIPIQFN